MREIKFRGWHKGYPGHGRCKPILPKMIYDDKIGDVLHWIAQGQPVEPMQFIGVLDKNKKEICEGDILKDWNKAEFTKKEYWFPIYKVEYKLIEFELIHIGGGKSAGDWYLPLTNWRRMEIIGNIYENPELLK